MCVDMNIDYNRKLYPLLSLLRLKKAFFYARNCIFSCNIVHLHVFEDKYNILYMHDFNIVASRKLFFLITRDINSSQHAVSV